MLLMTEGPFLISFFIMSKVGLRFDIINKTVLIKIINSHVVKDVLEKRTEKLVLTYYLLI